MSDPASASIRTLSICALVGMLVIGAISCTARSCQRMQAEEQAAEQAAKQAEREAAYYEATEAAENSTATTAGTTVSTESAARVGKEQITVLVLNGCGIEEAALEAADKIRAEGFANVEAANALYYDSTTSRVSYYYQEHEAEANEIAALLGITGESSVYRHDDEGSDGWNDAYDICVLIGDPSAAHNAA